MADDAGRIEALYDTDVVAWAERQADALRRRASGDDLDYDNLAEEIEDLAKRELRACQSHVDVIIEHLLKLEFAVPALLVDNERGWRVSVRKSRDNLQDDLTPTLRRRVPQELPARCRKHAEYLVDLDLITAESAVIVALREGYSWAEITDEDWWPERR